ncbi:MAG: pyridoxal-dependent decarboxylase [Rhodothermales bacterium]
MHLAQPTPRYWQRLSLDVLRQRVFGALKQNVNFYDSTLLGVPASHLDSKVFNREAPILEAAPYIKTFVYNPNHIGCHTLGKSERFFQGTQALERELIHICATDILRAEPESCDGYVASGGTEANLQAVWVYRNYFMAEHGAQLEHIRILCSADTHYSAQKAANVLQVATEVIPIHTDTRRIRTDVLRERLVKLKAEGVTCAIVICNMMTTMFGSVDHTADFVEPLQDAGLSFKLHVDGAYGGFYYPFSNQGDTDLSFANPHVSSVTLDAHKMAQAPYGTGIFLGRKGLIRYAGTTASYVEGEDFTLVGSRSGANAVAVWMILQTHGPYEWYEKVLVLQNRTAWLKAQLDELGAYSFRHPHSNIITIQADQIGAEAALEFGLVPDNHHAPAWYKVVVMEHVTIDKLLPLLEVVRTNVG